MTDPANPTPRAIDRSTIEIDPRRVRVLFGGHVVADSRRAVILREPSRQPVWYFPRGDVEMTVLGQTRRQTVSPAKGVASYFTIYRDAHLVLRSTSAGPRGDCWSHRLHAPAFRI